MSEKAAVDTALQANKDHQYALKVYTERLEAELKTVDKLITAIDSDEDTGRTAETGVVSVEGASKPASVVLPKILLSDDSPFFEDAQWRKRYEDFVTVSQMKTKEHDALREAVRIENMRMYTFEAQSRNQPIDLKSFPPEHFERNTSGIDWRRVTVKMSSKLPSAANRTPKECEIRWLGHLHPSINHSTWAPEETDRLRNIVQSEGGDTNTTINWVDVAMKLGTNRTPIDCMRHGIQRKVHTWSSESDKKLLEAVELYGQNNWQLVAMNVSEDASGHQCQKRFFDTVNPALKSGPWTEEEDAKLRRAVAAFSGVSVPISGEGMNVVSGSGRLPILWQDVAPFVPGRNNNQCREHFQLLDKDRNKTTQQGSKGKGRATMRYDPTEGSCASEAETSTAKAVIKRTVKPRPRSVFKGKRKGKAKEDVNSADASNVENDTYANGNTGDELAEPQEDDSNIQDDEISISIPRAQPRPRPRKKAGTTVEKERNETEDKDKTVIEITDNTPKTKTDQKRKGVRAVKTSKVPTKRRGRISVTEDAALVNSDGNENKSDGLEQLTSSEPVSKRRKTSRQPNRGALENSQPADESFERSERASDTSILKDEPQGRRRSTRLAKGSR